MPRSGNLAIQFGKILIAGDGSTTIKDLEDTLGRILKAHGYPEEVDLSRRPEGTQITMDTKSKEPTIDEIETMANQVEASRVRL